MPRRKGRKSKKNTKSQKKYSEQKRQLIFKESGQEYAVVIATLGNCRFSVLRTNTDTKKLKEDLAHLPKKLKRIPVRVGTYVLVNLRPYQEGKVDIVYVYFPAEVRKLMAYEEIPLTMITEENSQEEEEEDDPVAFTETCISTYDENKIDEEIDNL